MAIDPRISLAGRVPSIGNVFSDALSRVQAHGQGDIKSRLLEAQADAAEVGVESSREKSRIQSLAIGALEILPDLERGDSAAVLGKLNRRKADLQARGVDTSDTDEAISLASTPGGLAQLRDISNQTVQLGQQAGVLQGQQGGFQFGSTLTLRDSEGNEFTQTQRRNPTTGEIESVVTPIGGASEPVGDLSIVSSSGETPEERASRESSKSIEAGQIARRTKAIDVALKKGGDAFDRIEPVQKAISNYDEAIAAIDAGAESGVFMSKLPSLKESSIKLDNVIKRMGLDVVGQTTFGALSEKELAFAVSAAIPDNLQPAELKVWLQAKKRAQQMVLERVQEAASFLSSGDHTLKDWIEFDKARQINAAAPQEASQVQNSPADSATAQPKIKFLGFE